MDGRAVATPGLRNNERASPACDVRTAVGRPVIDNDGVEAGRQARKKRRKSLRFIEARKDDVNVIGHDPTLRSRGRPSASGILRNTDGHRPTG